MLVIVTIYSGFQKKHAIVFHTSGSKLSDQSLSDKIKRCNAMEIDKDFNSFGILRQQWGRTTRQLNCGKP